MPDIPTEALQAAERAIRDGLRIHLGESALALAAQGQPLMLSGSEAEYAARLALPPAVPLIADQARAQERARIVAWLRENAARFRAMADTQERVGDGWRCIEKATLVEEVAAAIETAGGTPPTTCPPAAPESTHANETTPAPRIHHPKGERPAETLSAPHGEDAHAHADLRQRCADRLLAKDAESWGYGTFEGDREAALAVADEVLAVRDDELAQLREHVEDLNDLIRQERATHEETIRRAEQAEAAIARIRDLHHEYKIYDDCGHDAHNDNDERVVETDDGRYVCADGYRYSVCHECCTASGEPTEHCAETHDHTDGWQCATILALTEAGAVSEPTGSGRER